jgi:Protein of unknown function (DUF3040)
MRDQMSLSRRQRRLLNEIDDALTRSDSRLASMLATFGKLAADKERPGRGRRRTPRRLIMRAARGCARGIGAAEAACTAACVAAGYQPSSGPSAH